MEMGCEAVTFCNSGIGGRTLGVVMMDVEFKLLTSSNSGITERDRLRLVILELEDVECNFGIMVNGCFVFRYNADYSRVLYPDLETWKCLVENLKVGKETAEETLKMLAEMCATGGRWKTGVSQGGGKPYAIKLTDNRSVSVQLAKQWEKLPEAVRQEITKCRARIVRGEGGKAPEENSGEVTIIGLNNDDAVTANFYRADLGVWEDCEEMMNKHAGTVRAFLIHLTEDDKVDKAQFSICMGVIKKMGTEDAFVVQVSFSL
jgi:hypothetical protein